MKKRHSNTPAPTANNRIVTRAELDKLTQLKNRLPNYTLEYTMPGPDKARVHSNTQAELQARITRGERILSEAHQKLETNYSFASIEGSARAAYQKAAQPRDNDAERPPEQQRKRLMGRDR